VSKVPDPHIPISDGTLAASKGVAKTVGAIETVREYAFMAVVVIDCARLIEAAYKDYINSDNKIENTVKTGLSISATWTGGVTGGYLGSKFGAAAGGAIGSVFGGVGAVPGAGEA
jgi:hypothetical protein